jgi:hypothetical protein
VRTVGWLSCRCKQALSELRHLKSEAREAGKLLEDKKVLEVKVRWLSTAG